MGIGMIRRVEERMTSTLNGTEADTVLSWLRAYNLAANPQFMQLRELPENQAKPLDVFAFADFIIVGGLLGETQCARMIIHGESGMGFRALASNIQR